MPNAGQTFEPLSEEIENTARVVVDAAMKVHRTLGPGLLESVYEACLCRELQMRGIDFRRQVAVPVKYAGESVECGFRIDILVAESIVLELKAVEHVLPIHEAQLLTYMKLSRHRLGLLSTSIRHC
ncbi:MAG: GxxExxY protein [Planctomycetales bacterium]|nr:GxxExxY protein [Planctomycetales bacterium]